MSLDDPYFDDWVRDKINQLEAKTPDHLWDAIRNSSRFYIIVDRNKYLLALLVLLISTGTVGYWAFHPKQVPSNTIASIQKPAGSPSIRTSAVTLSTQPPAGSPSVKTDAGAHAQTRVTGVPVATGPDDHAAPESADVFAIALAAAQPGRTQPIGTASIAGEPAQTSAGEPAETSSKTLNAVTLETTLLAKPPTGASPAKPSGIALSASTRETSRRKIYWEAFAGPDHVVHYIKASSTQYEGYVRQVKATESSYPSFSLGLKADLPMLGENWRMQVGLRFSQINEELNYTYIQGNKTTVKYSFNTYRGIDLPILTSYTLVHSQQLEFRVSGGALFNLASWFRGDVLDTNLQPMALHIKDDTKGTPQSKVWKNSLGTSLYTSVTLYDQVVPKVQVGIEPYLRYELSPVNRAVSIYTERFVTTGLMFNIRFQLGQ
jgi:hypothetical protein